MYDAKAVMLQEQLKCYCSTNKAKVRPAAQSRASSTASKCRVETHYYKYASLKSVKDKTDPDLSFRKDTYQETCYQKGSQEERLFPHQSLQVRT